MRESRHGRGRVEHEESLDEDKWREGIKECGLHAVRILNIIAISTYSSSGGRNF